MDLGVGRMAAHLTLRGSAFVYLVTRERQVNGGHLATGPWRAALGSVGSAQSRGPSVGGWGGERSALGSTGPRETSQAPCVVCSSPSTRGVCHTLKHLTLGPWRGGGDRGLHQAALPEAVLGRASTQALISQALVMISFTIS